MSAIVADQVKLLLLKQQLSRPPFTAARIGLFTLDLAISHATTLNNLLPHELLTAGYSRQPLANWSEPSFTLDFHALSFCNSVNFGNSSNSNSPPIWGWFYVDEVGQRLIVVGKYQTPKVISAHGIYRTTPFYQLTGE